MGEAWDACAAQVTTSFSRAIYHVNLESIALQRAMEHTPSRALPAELISKILLWLDLRGLLRCRLVRRSHDMLCSCLLDVQMIQVCRAFRDLIDTHPELIYVLELRVAGLVETLDASPVPDLQVRRELLRHFVHSHRQPQSWSRITEEQGDVERLTARLSQKQPHQPIYIGNVLFFPYSIRARGLQAYLPNVVECTALRPDRRGDKTVTRWSLKFNDPIIRLSADPGQNLVVLLMVPPTSVDR